MVKIILIFLRSEVSRKMTSNRTENNVKNRFNSLMKREKLNLEDLEDDNLIIRQILNFTEAKLRGQLNHISNKDKKEYRRNKREQARAENYTRGSPRSLTPSR